MRVILDTSAWYSFVSEDDNFHKSAVDVVNEKPLFLILYPVLEELTAILHHRKGKAITLKTVEFLKQRSISKIIYLNPRVDDEIWSVYKSEKNFIDYVDASIIWLSKKESVSVFSFDSHFRKLGLKVLP